MGTNWHKLHEIYAAEMSHARKVTAEIIADNPTAKPESGEDAGHAYGLDAVIAHLNEQYKDVPATKDPKEWAIERQILLTSFIAYQWYYQNDPVEVLASEVPFNLPLHVPKVGMPLPMDEVQRVGKMDHIIRWQKMVGVLERKSTSRSIALDSDYWDKAKKDIQVSGYATAIRDMIASGQLPESVKFSDGETIGNTCYDCWHKPTIKPKMLTQADTAAFIESGEYCGQKFEVIASGDLSTALSLTVDGESPDIEPGKKGFAIRESVGMFGARLLADIYERPDFYFIRKEIPRTDQDIADYRKTSFALYQSQKMMAKHDIWYENANSCRSPFPCPMLSICYGVGADHICKTGETPAGYKRIFTPLTLEGKTFEED